MNAPLSQEPEDRTSPSVLAFDETVTGSVADNGYQVPFCT